MSIFDIVVAAVLLYGFIKGVKEGLFVEAASLVALIVGVYGATHFSYIVADYMTPNFSWQPKYISLTAFAITFIIIVIIISLAGKLLTKIADFAHLGWINKMAGGAFGALKWALIFSVVLMVFDKLNTTLKIVSEETKQNTILYQPIKSLAVTLFPDLVKGAQDKPTQENGH